MAESGLHKIFQHYTLGKKDKLLKETHGGSANFVFESWSRIPRDDLLTYRSDDKSLTRPGRKQATETEDFDVYVSYL